MKAKIVRCMPNKNSVKEGDFLFLLPSEFYVVCDKKSGKRLFGSFSYYSCHDYVKKNCTLPLVMPEIVVTKIDNPEYIKYLKTKDKKPEGFVDFWRKYIPPKYCYEIVAKVQDGEERVIELNRFGEEKKFNSVSETKKAITSWKRKYSERTLESRVTATIQKVKKLPFSVS